MIGSEKRRCEGDGMSDDEMTEELKDIVDTAASYPQCKSTFAQKVRMSTMIGKVTGD